MIYFKEMAEEEFADFKPRLIERYASQLARSIATSRQEAQQSAREQIAELLADGPATPAHQLYFLVREGTSEQIGYLWYSLSADGQRAFIHDIYIYEQYHSRGFDMAVVNKMTAELRSSGIKRVQLQVFAHDSSAIALYSQQGYRTIGVMLQKDL